MRTLIQRLLLATVAATALVATASAQDRVPPPADVLNLDASVSTEVSPDLAIFTLAVVREGPDVAPLTKDVNATLAKAVADAKAVPSVLVSNGSYSTFPRYETRNNQSVRNGWTVRAELIVKSRDFNAIGALVGRLSDTMQITGSAFDLSPELRAKESSALIDRAAQAFQEKAAAASRAFGYAGYSIREVTMGGDGQGGGPRPMMLQSRMALKDAAAPVPVESGRITLTVTVNGSVLMRR